MRTARSERLQRQLERDRRHGQPGRRIRDAIHTLQRLLRATALIPEGERSELILSTEKKARRMIAGLRPMEEQLREEYFPK